MTLEKVILEMTLNSAVDYMDFLIPPPFFEVPNLVGFSTFTRLCNYYHYLAPEHSIIPKRNCSPNSSHLPLSLLPAPTNH